jgi:hypothetical protein
VLEEQLAIFRREYQTIKEQERTLLEQGTTAMMEGTKTEQKRIHEDELDAFLGGGWVFVATLPSGMVLIQKA